MMVRLAKTLVIGIALLVLGGGVGYGTGFTDVPQGTWYTQAVAELSGLGMITGVSGTSLFLPHSPAKRAEFVKMCLLALHDDDGHYPPPEQPPFPDVPVSEWYSGYVDVAKLLEVIDSARPIFEPGRNITRREAASMVARVLHLQGGLRSRQSNCLFSDVASSESDILEVCRAGLMRGYGDGRFQPDREITRAEAAVLLWKARELPTSDLAAIRMEAFVSSSRYLPEQPVPADRVEIGIRLNNAESPQNLIRVNAQAHSSTSGIKFVLRRSNGNLRVWWDRAMETPLLGGNNEAEIDSPEASNWSFYVENVSSGVGDLFLEARKSADESVVGFARLRFRTFKNFVVVVGGEGQEPQDYDPANPNLCSDTGCGVFDLARIFYKQGYDVEIYDDDWIGPSGGGLAYEDVVAAVEQRDVEGIILIGYSHGGGSVFDLAQELGETRHEIDGSFALKVTTYIDAVTNETAGAENRYPTPSDYHINLYQRHCAVLFCGGPVLGSAVQLDMADLPYGVDITHSYIDNFYPVWDAVLGGVEERLGNER